MIYFFVLTRCWKWPAWRAGLLVGLFLVFDVTYFGTNLLKILDGGWFTLMAALLFTLVMTAWKDGRAALAQTMSEGRIDVGTFLKDVAADPADPGSWHSRVHDGFTAEGCPAPFCTSSSSTRSFTNG